MARPRDNESSIGLALLGLVVCVPLGTFEVGATVLVGHLVAESTWEFISLPVAGALMLGSFAVLDLMVRLMGTERMLKAADAFEGGSLPVGYRGTRRRDEAENRSTREKNRSTEFGVMEVAFLPVLMLLPVSLVGYGSETGNVAAAAVLLTGIAVVSLPLGFGMEGQSMLSVGTAVLGLPWGVWVAHGNFWTGSLAGVLFGTAGWVVAYRAHVTLRRSG